MKRKTKILDCRELEPPEPMVRVLEAVEELQENETVLMIHRKEPILIYGKRNGE